VRLPGNAVPGRYVVGVASWDADAETTLPVDFRLVHNMFVTMFWRSSLLNEMADWLRSHGYDVAEFDAGSWASAGDMFDDLAKRLHFPGYFGRNLDALNDCMRDVASHEYGSHADATGLVIVLRAFDTFATVDRRTAQTMLDIFADQAGHAILIGNRIICLVQSNDPQLSFGPVGAMPVMWNDAEWLNSRRGRCERGAVRRRSRITIGRSPSASIAEDPPGTASFPREWPFVVGKRADRGRRAAIGVRGTGLGRGGSGRVGRGGRIVRW
jgi:RNAse (barnase) inhibitor barstar